MGFHWWQYWVRHPGNASTENLKCLGYSILKHLLKYIYWSTRIKRLFWVQNVSENRTQRGKQSSEIGFFFRVFANFYWFLAFMFYEWSWRGRNRKRHRLEIYWSGESNRRPPAPGNWYPGTPTSVIMTRNNLCTFSRGKEAWKTPVWNLRTGLGIKKPPLKMHDHSWSSWQ